MIFLAATTDKLQLVTSAAAAIDVNASFVDAAKTTGVTSDLNRQNTAITTATTSDILAAPGASTARNLKQMTIRNKDATLSCDVTVLFNQNATLYEIHKQTLLPGESLEYIEGVGFFTLQPSLNVTRVLTSAESSNNQNVLTSVVSRAAVSTFVTISGTAYYIYVGRIVKNITVLFAEFHVTTAGAGTQTAEIGLFSTPSPPNKSTQTLTKIATTGTVDSVLTTGVKRNTASFAQGINAGTHLWAAIRFAMATTQPTCAGLAADMSQAHILTTTGGGTLTGLTSASGTIPAIATATVAPDVRVTLN